ncbi:MAG: metal ABC transporter substrate-binding protein, partial [Elusimicrobia bacterium]|nr:metal ABC transporter substrate-binding protein [Elusimicrobiota bacterium]
MKIIFIALALILPAQNGFSLEKLKVAATIFPLYDFARAIGGDKVDVSLLISPGVEVHHFEPKPKDMIRASKADLFFYCGKIMEPWAEKFAKNLKSAFAVDVSVGANYISSSAKNSGLDPHIWLDFNNAKIMADNIAQAFIAKDPA